MARRRPTADAAPNIVDADIESDAEERGPLRRCIVTHTQGERARMIRFVLGPASENGTSQPRHVVPDLSARLPGRGMWLSARADVIEAARAKGAFARAARGQVTLPADMQGILRAGLERRIVDHLGLARRAGQAVAGFAKARDWLTQGRAAGVIEAADGSEAERARLIGGAGARIWVAWPLAAATLGGVFGRDVAVHVAVAPGRLADALLIEIERLAGITGQALVKQAGE